MVEMKFTQDMIKTIQSMKGKTITSYQCAKIDEWSRTYGNFRINFEDYAIDFTNRVKGVPFFDEVEEVAGFECAKVYSDAPYEPGIVRDVQIVPVDEVVQSIEVITDEIDVNHGEYQITFDEAVIIHTEYQTIMFSRDVWFSEIIHISTDDNYDNIYPIDSVIENWNNEGDYEVIVKRTKKEL